MTDCPLPRRARTLSCFLAACLLSCWPALSSPVWAQPTSLDDLVRAAIKNQIEDDSHTHLFAWKVRRYHGLHTQVELEIQTPGGSLNRLELIDDRALNPVQQKAEQERVRNMINPAQMRRKLKEDQEDDARTRKLLQSIPNAFDFALLDRSTGPDGHTLTSIRFTPRPGFNPPSREVTVLTGMQGDILLDETASRLIKIDGTLFKDVTFGWGIFGRLNKGGRFLVQQTEIAPSHWEITHMLLHFDGKVLLFKSIHIDENETYWDFQPVPPMTVEQALDYLKNSDPAQDAKLHR